MGLIHSSISRPEYKPIPKPIIEKPLKPRTQEEIEYERIQKEEMEKFINLSCWVIEKIKAIMCKRPKEFIIELPLH